jgi:formylglycine-generating enzyme required for sulfatase activity
MILALGMAAALVGCPGQTSTPIAAFSMDQQIAEAPITVEFTDLSVPPPSSKLFGNNGNSTPPTLTSWAWDFGDGATSTEQNPTHTYGDPGVYTASLTVTASDGTTSTFTRRNGVVALDPQRVVGAEPGEERTIAGIEFVWIPAGTFSMGVGPDGYGNLEYTEEDAMPAHEVTITNGYWMSKYEINQGEYFEYMDFNPSLFDELPLEADYPVDSVSWNMAQNFVDALNATGEAQFRLPTEAEWEHAARAGTDSLFFFGNDLSDFDLYSASVFTSPYSTSPTGSFLPNPWGLYDIYGNVMEWTSDYYSSTYYTAEPQTNPFGPMVGSYHTTRGASYRDPFYMLNSIMRIGYVPTSTYHFMGMRIIAQ